MSLDLGRQFEVYMWKLEEIAYEKGFQLNITLTPQKILVSKPRARGECRAGGRPES
jgi:hypothetical protein